MDLILQFVWTKLMGSRKILHTSTFMIFKQNIEHSNKIIIAIFKCLVLWKEFLLKEATWEPQKN